MKTLISLLLLALLAVPAGVGFLLFKAIGDKPLVIKEAPVANTENARRVKQLVSQIRSGKNTEITISEQDLEGIIAFAVRGIPSASADARIDAQGLEAHLTIALPANPVGPYLNLGFAVLPSTHGLELKHLMLGETEISAQFLKPVFGWGLDYLFGPGIKETLTNVVTQVRFSENKMFLMIAADQNSAGEISGKLNNLFDRIKDNEQLRIADPELVQIYFKLLQDTAASLRGGYVPLTRYLKPVFELAVSRGQLDETRAIAENQAAILALAIYFGDERMQSLVSKSDNKYFSGSRMGSHNVTIKGRHDLVQHYLTSAGLKLAAGVGIANAIGEFKEIADTLRGGSGFSFSDIAGDKAGVTLAALASEAATAIPIQNALAGINSEADFFPDITGLPDNMTQAEFERRYGDVESERYKELLLDIDRRIAQVPAYGGG